ncbi:MAG: SDR family NAD(P)-dependent oxidoreductase [Planctomycetota bacterium]|jgi:3-oxoacyl-[acyl-carrier protein] reductase
MKSLDGQVALVTGANRGIGRAVALALADLGAQIVAAARNRQLLDQLVAEIEEAGGKAAAVVFDLADESTINALVEQVKSQFGRLDILVNNAGLTHSAPLEETTTADFDRIMAVNARGPYILTRQCLPLLKAAPQATIVNISSVVGVKGYPKQSAYTASKHALRGWSIALAEELRGTNVRVHVLCPGGVDTDMVGNVRPDIPKDALISPEEIAELVVYCATHKGNAVIDEFRIRRTASAPWF